MLKARLRFNSTTLRDDSEFVEGEEGELTEHPDGDLISSKLGWKQDGEAMHAPALDLDVPHTYVPSSTEGHGHLYIDVALTWPQYVELLEVLERCGIIGPGFLMHSLRQGLSTLRKPGLHKGAR